MEHVVAEIESSRMTGLLSLPFEIRCQILSSFIRTDDVFEFWDVRPPDPTNLWHSSEDSNGIFLICSTITNDCRQMLYGSNSFRFRQNSILNVAKFVSVVGVECAKYIKHLEIDVVRNVAVYSARSPQVTGVSLSLPGLETVTFHDDCPDYRRARDVWIPTLVQAIELFTAAPGSLYKGRVFLLPRVPALRGVNRHNASVKIYRADTKLRTPDDNEVDMSVEPERRNREVRLARAKERRAEIKSEAARTK